MGNFGELAISWKIAKFKTRQIEYYIIHYRSMQKGSQSLNLNSPMHSDAQEYIIEREGEYPTSYTAVQTRCG